MAIVGAGAVGARAARQLLATAAVDEVVVRDTHRAVAEAVVRSLGPGAVAADSAERVAPDADAVLLATPYGHHLDLARDALIREMPVVSVSDDVDDVRALLRLDSRARTCGVPLVVGAGFMPGLTGVLARHGARSFDTLLEIHVAKMGTGGPACARQRHRALGDAGEDWRDGAWVRRPGGSGRELCWFPSPIDAHDCYTGALPDTLLLQSSFAEVERITSRMAATRRDRLTMHVPMLRSPHPEGRAGAVRVELRGVRRGVSTTMVLGAVHPPAVAAGTVAALAITWLLAGRIHEPGAAALAAMVEPTPFLAELGARGLATEVFEGLDAAG
ncbi:MAG: NAD(P)-binding domain-containing protein [Acidimicrobiia bacterium]|nr:NAD(P)-binding domain-containing protein [Acidimicrobiia bacterium]MDH5236082.1 NAD(P)-binding domain-containing protein [Acidimicrobiia bacterium]